MITGRTRGRVLQVIEQELRGTISVTVPDGTLTVEYDANSFTESYTKLSPGDQVSLFVNQHPSGPRAGGIEKL